jgi:hypothetical protein
MVRPGPHAALLGSERVDRVVVDGIHAGGHEHGEEKEAAPLHLGEHEG